MIYDYEIPRAGIYSIKVRHYDLGSTGCPAAGRDLSYVLHLAAGRESGSAPPWGPATHG